MLRGYDRQNEGEWFLLARRRVDHRRIRFEFGYRYQRDLEFGYRRQRENVLRIADALE